MNKLTQVLALLLFLTMQMHVSVHQLEHLPGGDHYQDFSTSSNSGDGKHCHLSSHGSTLLTSHFPCFSASPATGMAQPPVFSHFPPRLWRSQWAQGPPAIA